jgi:hypothetical protein
MAAIITTPRPATRPLCAAEVSKINNKKATHAAIAAVVASSKEVMIYIRLFINIQYNVITLNSTLSDKKDHAFSLSKGFF